VDLVRSSSSQCPGSRSTQLTRRQSRQSGPRLEAAAKHRLSPGLPPSRRLSSTETAPSAVLSHMATSQGRVPKLKIPSAASIGGGPDNPAVLIVAELPPDVDHIARFDCLAATMGSLRAFYCDYAVAPVLIRFDKGGADVAGRAGDDRNLLIASQSNSPLTSLYSVHRDAIQNAGGVAPNR
jgi:hypothetical protein